MSKGKKLPDGMTALGARGVDNTSGGSSGKKPRAGSSTGMSGKAEKPDPGPKSFEKLSKVYDKRFLEMGEKIEELRSSLGGKVKATPGNQKPDTILPDSKAHVIDARVDANQKAIDSILAEIRGFRQQMVKFGGMDEALSISRKMLDEANKIKGINSRIEISSDKVREIFLELQRKRGEVDGFGERMARMEKEFSDIKAMSAGFARKSDLRKLSSTVNGRAASTGNLPDLNTPSVKTVAEGIESMKKEISGIKATISGLETPNEAVHNIESDTGKVQEELKSLSAHVSRIDDFQSAMNDRIGELEVALEDVKEPDTLSGLRKIGKSIGRFTPIKRASRGILDEKAEDQPVPEEPADQSSQVLSEESLEKEPDTSGSETPEETPEQEEVQETGPEADIPARIPDTETPATEPGSEYSLSELKRFIEEGDVMAAGIEYKRLYAIYENMPRDSPEAEKLFEELTKAFNKIKEMSK
jgi:predicted  nucleic acid-binding Zn-ribbon protein